MAKMTCPICKGSGKIHEDSVEYEFISRDAITKRCLYCDGSGMIAPRVKLPDGRFAHELNPGRDMSRRLNVSKKAVINPEAIDTGVGYVADTPMCETKREPNEKIMFLEMALNTRLNKVLASGLEFLIVNETEPYYLDVYRMIRAQEKKQDTWTKQDEDRYVELLERQIDLLKEASNG